MRKKRVNFLLIALVTGVWGTIIYRVIIGLVETGAEEHPAVVTVAKKRPNDFAIRIDTSELRLNYRDPFSGNVRKPTSVTIDDQEATAKSTNPVPKPALTWPSLNYDGYIRGSNQRLTALIRINGRQAALAEGETDGNITLMKNLRDSVRIRFGREIRFIKINYQ